MYIGEVIEAFKEKTKKEFNLEVACGYFGANAFMSIDIEKFVFRFAVPKKCNIEEARELLVILKEQCAEMINRHEGIRPYLRSYPFSPLDTKIDLYFEEDGTLSHMFATDNEIQYFAKNSKTQNDEKLLEETFEEAVKIVKAKQSKVCDQGTYKPEFWVYKSAGQRVSG